MVNTRGAYYYFEESRLGHGIKNTLQELEKSPELLDKIREMCYNVIINKEELPVDEDADVIKELLD